MPSVRVKRGGSYAPLRDQPSQSRPLGEIFTQHALPQPEPQQEPLPPPPPLQQHPSSSPPPPSSPSLSSVGPSAGSPLIEGTHLQGIPEGGISELAHATDDLPLPQRPLTRPRAGSRVSRHVLSKTSLHQLFAPPADLPAPGSQHSLPLSKRTASPTNMSRRTASPARSSQGPMRTLEGPQAEVQIAADGEAQDGGILGSALSLTRSGVHGEGTDDFGDREGEHHHDDIVEHLDVIDPQVATVSTLTNAANAILIPPLSFYSRKPVVVLSSPPRAEGDAEQGKEGEPHEDALDRHVDDVLEHPSPIRRTLKGVWSFLKTPLGIFTAVYGFLVAFWGAAIVIFLAKIINLHNANTQGFWVEVSSQVTNGLFTLTGIGLIPPRALDTFRVVKIWHYKRRTRRLRAEAGLPQLYDVDDLPDPAYDPNYVHVLSEAEQRDLHHQQVRFQKHQTWYRAHGTETHRAFPINTALIICLCNDGNSFFQIILCSCMWSMDRFTRPAWTTGTLIPASFLCGIAAAVFIARGGKRTKRTKEVAERLRQALLMEDAEHPNDPPRPERILDTGMLEDKVHLAPPQPEEKQNLTHPQRDLEKESLRGQSSGDEVSHSELSHSEYLDAESQVARSRTSQDTQRAES